MMFGWRCECSHYKQKNGFVYPTEIKAIKVYPDKEIVYFDADNYIVKYIK